MINPKLKRFIETTIPMVIGYGLVVWVTTYYVGLFWGLMSIVVFAIVDVLTPRPEEIQPSHIKWNGKYYATLTELIKYVETHSK